MFSLLNSFGMSRYPSCYSKDDLGVNSKPWAENWLQGHIFTQGLNCHLYSPKVYLTFLFLSSNNKEISPEVQWLVQVATWVTSIPWTLSCITIQASKDQASLFFLRDRHVTFSFTMSFSHFEQMLQLIESMATSSYYRLLGGQWYLVLNNFQVWMPPGPVPSLKMLTGLIELTLTQLKADGE